MKLLKQINQSRANNTNSNNNISSQYYQNDFSNFYLMPSYATLPILLHLQQAPTFSLENCSFLVQKDREHTARIVAWREFDIPLSYTIECSSSGCNEGPYAGQHLNINQLENAGMYIASSFGYLDFLYCSNRHVPMIVMPSQMIKKRVIQHETTSPIHHPGNDDYLK